MLLGYEWDEEYERDEGDEDDEDGDDEEDEEDVRLRQLVIKEGEREVDFLRVGSPENEGEDEGEGEGDGEDDSRLDGGEEGEEEDGDGDGEEDSILTLSLDDDDDDDDDCDCGEEVSNISLNCTNFYFPSYLLIVLITLVLFSYHPSFPHSRCHMAVYALSLLSPPILLNSLVLYYLQLLSS